MEELNAITRKEKFLAKAAGQDVETPEPITREEMFLSKIAGGGGLPVLDIVFPTFGEGSITDEKVIESLNAFSEQGVSTFLLNCEITDANAAFASSCVMNVVKMAGLQMFTALFVIEGVMMVALIPSDSGWNYNIAVLG